VDQIEEGIAEILYRILVNYFHFSSTTPINSREKECYSYKKPRNEIGNQSHSCFHGVELLFLTEVCLDASNFFSPSPVWLRHMCSQLTQLFLTLIFENHTGPRSFLGTYESSVNQPSGGGEGTFVFQRFE